MSAATVRATWATIHQARAVVMASSLKVNDQKAMLSGRLTTEVMPYVNTIVPTVITTTQ